MVIKMGLHSGIYAAHEYSMVQYPEFSRNRFISIWNGCDDNVTYIAQRYRTIQSGMPAVRES